MSDIQVRMEQVIPGGSVWLGSGTDTETGRHITFGGDARMMAAISQALDDGEEDVVAEVPEWSVLGNIVIAQVP